MLPLRRVSRVIRTLIMLLIIMLLIKSSLTGPPETSVVCAVVRYAVLCVVLCLFTRYDS